MTRGEQETRHVRAHFVIVFEEEEFHKQVRKPRMAVKGKLAIPNLGLRFAEPLPG